MIHRGNQVKNDRPRPVIPLEQLTFMRLGFAGLERCMLNQCNEQHPL